MEQAIYRDEELIGYLSAAGLVLPSDWEWPCIPYLLILAAARSCANTLAAL